MRKVFPYRINFAGVKICKWFQQHKYLSLIHWWHNKMLCTNTFFSSYMIILGNIYINIVQSTYMTNKKICEDSYTLYKCNIIYLWYVRNKRELRQEKLHNIKCYIIINEWRFSKQNFPKNFSHIKLSRYSIFYKFILFLCVCVCMWILNVCFFIVCV